jgi:hypothetical protein
MFRAAALISRRCLGADLGVSMRRRDVVIGEPGADARPCRPEFRLGIVEIGRGSAVTGGYRPAAEIAIPCSLRLAGRRADGAHDPADGEAAPDHKEVVIATDAADHANLISRAGTVPTEFAQWAFYGTLARRARRRSYLAVPSMFIWQPMLMRESAALV